MTWVKDYYNRVLIFINDKIDSVDDFEQIELLEELHKARLDVIDKLKVISEVK